jgi:hypothetical protein
MPTSARPGRSSSPAELAALAGGIEVSPAGDDQELSTR